MTGLGSVMQFGHDRSGFRDSFRPAVIMNAWEVLLGLLVVSVLEGAYAQAGSGGELVYSFQRLVPACEPLPSLSTYSATGVDPGRGVFFAICLPIMVISCVLCSANRNRFDQRRRVQVVQAQPGEPSRPYNRCMSLALVTPSLLLTHTVVRTYPQQVRIKLRNEEYEQEGMNGYARLYMHDTTLCETTLTREPASQLVVTM